MKSVMLSIRPEWCEKILDGQKTIEVRKSKPKLEAPFKVYIYCTKGKDRLLDVIKDGDDISYLSRIENDTHHGAPIFIKTFPNSMDFSTRGKVIAEFTCNKIRGYGSIETAFDWSELMKLSCLTGSQIEKYGKSQNLYGWHISDLKVYDKPKEITDFYRACNEKCEDCKYYYTESNESIGFYEGCSTEGRLLLTRPPQSWCYVEEL